MDTLNFYFRNVIQGISIVIFGHGVKLNRVSLVLCIIMCGPLRISVSGQILLPFINDNSTNLDCSWMFYDGSGQQIQPCYVWPYDETVYPDVCPDPIPYPENEEDRARKVDDFKLTEITTSIEFPTDPHRSGNYTCVQISYTIPDAVARLIKAVQFSLRSINSDDSDDHVCQVHVYSDGMSSQSDGLKYYSVIDYDNCGTTEDQCARKVFIHDKFCGVIPGAAYAVSVRPLPVDYSNDNGNVRDTKLTKRYPDDAENASMSCNDKPDDIRCRKSKQASWSSAYIIVEQDNSRRSNTSVNITVTFNVAPADYGFTIYSANLYDNVGDYYKSQRFELTHEKSELQNLTWIVNEVPVSDCYRFRVIPLPRSLCTRGIDERQVNCNKIYGDVFCPKVHPCATHPCSDNGICQSPDGENYECICNTGYVLHNNTCLIHPCATHPCSDNGICQSPDGENYECICNTGYVLHNNTCLKNPCWNETGDDIGLCGPNGTCKLDLLSNNSIQPNYTCACKHGYQLRSARKCIALSSIPMIAGSAGISYYYIIAAIAGSVVAILLLLGISYRMFSKTNKDTFHVSAPSSFFKQSDDDTGSTGSDYSGQFDEINDNGCAPGLPNDFHSVQDPHPPSTIYHLQRHNVIANKGAKPPSLASPTATGDSYGAFMEACQDLYNDDISPPRGPPLPQPQRRNMVNTASDVRYVPEPITLLHSQDMDIHSNGAPGSSILATSLPSDVHIYNEKISEL